MMENTYTYTARSADDPKRVVTFTLYDHHLVVDVGVPIEHVERALQGRDAEEESEHNAQPWLKPVAVSAIERGLHPFNVADVYANADGGGLSVAVWVRAGGLRLAPVVFTMEQVDNLDAAQAFVEELDRRKASAARLGWLPGILDYWASWFLGFFSLVAVLAVWLRRKYRRVAA
jgi:hypothetical protein